jgi:hypothetical protein
MSNTSRRGGSKQGPSASENTTVQATEEQEPVPPATTPQEAGEEPQDPAANVSAAGSSVKEGDLPQGTKSRADFIRAQEASQWGADAEDAVRDDDPDKADLIQRIHTGDRD